MRILFFLLFISISGSVNAQLNIQFRSQVAYGVSNELANIGGYVDSTGKEYALVGCQAGLSIVDVTNPAAPFIKVLIPGANSYWREVKVRGKYAYVTTEASNTGLQIVNLGKLPGTITASDYKYWTGSGAITGMISRLHSLHIDNGYAYLNGVNGGALFGGACLIISLADPWNPVYMGNTELSFTGNNRYMHDCFVRNDTLWGAHIYGGFFSVISVTNKSAPVLLSSGTQPTPGAFTHNTWLSTSGPRTLFTTDEVSNSFLTSWDVTSIGNITELDRIQLNAGSGAIVHNVHILNNYAIVSWYKEGIAIVDVSRPDNMIITGYYDTYSQGSGNGFNGCWGVYPYLPSGNIVASDINNGLFVLTPTYVRGCYLEGVIKDSCTGNVIPNVTVTINTANVTSQGKVNGIYKTGTAASGIYSATFSKTGYQSKTITGISLSNGVLTALNVQLKPSSVVSITGAAVIPANCNGSNNGAINVSAAGGSVPYAWLWSNGSNTEDQSNLISGNYTATVTDAGGCKSTSTYFVSQPSAITSSFTSVLPSCTGKNDGSITGYINGGSPGYSFSWGPLRLQHANGPISELIASVDTTSLTGAGAGNYNLTVTDAHGCNVNFPVTLADAINPCSFNLNVKVFTEGFYRSTGSMTSLIPPGGIAADSFIVKLALDSNSFPVLYSDTAVIDTTGWGIFTFPAALWSKRFYVILKHRSSIETWSAVPVLFNAANCYYDFTLPQAILNPSAPMMRKY